MQAAYLDWFRDVTGAGFAPLLPEVGHAAENPIVLEAPLAKLAGGVTFSNGTGYAHEWVKGWTSTAAVVSWDVDVKTAGRYGVTLAFACPAADAGSRIALTVGSSRAEATVPAAAAPYLPLANRAEATDLRAAPLGEPGHRRSAARPRAPDAAAEGGHEAGCHGNGTQAPGTRAPLSWTRRGRAPLSRA